MSFYNDRQPSSPPPIVPPSSLPSPSCSHQLNQGYSTLTGNAPVTGNLLGAQPQAHTPNQVHHSYDLRRKLSSHFQYQEGLIANQVTSCVLAVSTATSPSCTHISSSSGCTLSSPVPRKKSKRSCSICNSPNEGMLITR